MKIYTKTGDEGETGMLGGVRLSKSHLVVEVVGTIDETNSLIGLVLSEGVPPVIKPMLTQIQNDLFDLGSRVAACLSDSSDPAEFPPIRAVQLESWIDESQQELPELKEFILPGGSRAGASLHLARAVCRRAERRLVELKNIGIERDLSSELIYLNRLSDLLFVLARLTNHSARATETKWKVTR